MRRNPGLPPYLRRDVRVESFPDKPGKRLKEGILPHFHFPGDDAGSLRHRHQWLAVSFGQPFDQGGDSFPEQAGHSPVYGFMRNLVQTVIWDLESHPVFLSAGNEFITGSKAASAYVQFVRKPLQFPFVRAGTQQVFLRHFQKTITALLPDARLQAAPVGYAPQPAGIKIKDLFFGGHDAPAPQLVFHSGQAVIQGQIVPQKIRLVSHLSFHQGRHNEYVMGFTGMDGAVRHFSSGNNFQSIESHALVGPDLSPLEIPVGMGIGTAAQFPPQFLQPGRIDFCGGPGEQPAGADHFRSHNPRRRFIKKRGAGKKHGRSSACGLIKALFLMHRDTGKIAAANRPVCGVRFLFGKTASAAGDKRNIHLA